MRTALVHDWFSVPGGAESVFERIMRILPDSTIYALFNFSENRAFLQGRMVQTSFLQRLPFVRKHYRQFLPLMPLAIEQFDLSAYDLVISSSHAVAKGVLTGPDQLHISYVHTPMRYAWDLTAEYLREAGVHWGLRSGMARLILHYIRLWDQAVSQRVDVMVANSHFVARRIQSYYRRHARVIYPPVDTTRFALEIEKDDYYLTAGRMVPYKRMHLIVEAFARMPNRRLIVIGDGPEAAKVRSRAAPNITIMGPQPVAALCQYMQRARGFVFAAREDFGITPVEAQSCGTPVIAFGKGGVLETVIDGQTGVFYAEQSAAAIVEAIVRFERLSTTFDPYSIREHALEFAVDRFESQFSELVEREWDRFVKRSHAARQLTKCEATALCIE